MKDRLINRQTHRHVLEGEYSAHTLLRCYKQTTDGQVRETGCGFFSNTVGPVFTLSCEKKSNVSHEEIGLTTNRWQFCT